MKPRILAQTRAVERSGRTAARGGGQGPAPLRASERSSAGSNIHAVLNSDWAKPRSPSITRALIVDDNHDAADSLGMLLEMLGVEVRTAYAAMPALATLSDFAPHVVFADLCMPGMDGYELAQKIRTQTRLPGVRLVAVSGWGQEPDRQRALREGFDFHLVKPASRQEVEAILGASVLE